MLLGGRQPDIKKVAVLTRNRQFNKLLRRILVYWKFCTVEDPSEANIIIAERGIQLPAHEAQLIWLTSMPLREGRFLMVPLSLTELYHLLEAQMFPVPRRHIRVAMNAAVDLKLENEWLEGRLVSLSCRGGRIICPYEMPRGKMLHVEVTLGGRKLAIQSEVLYCIPAGDASSRLLPHVGVLFKSLDGCDLDMLRRFIEKTSVESACSREAILRTDSCMTWLDLSTNPLHAEAP